MKYRLLLTVVIAILGTSLKAQQYSLDSLYSVLQTEIDDNTKVDTWNAISWELKYQNTDSATFYGEKALKLSEKINYKKGISIAKRTLGTIYYVQGRVENSLIFVKEASSIAEEIDDKYQIAKCYNMLGNIYQHFNSPDTVIMYLEKALELFTEINDELEIAGVTANLAQNYRGLGNYTIAIELLYKVLELEEKLNNKVGIARTYNSLANTYSDLGEPEKAIDFFEKVIPILKELNHNKWLSASYNNLAGIYDDYNDTLALEYYNKALEINIMMHDTLWISYNYNNISTIYLKQKNYDKAFEYAYMSNELQDKIGIEEATTFSHLGNVFYATKEYKKALDLYQKALKISQLNKNIGNIKHQYSNLHSAYKKLNNHEKSLECLEKYINYSDSLDAVTDLQEIGRLEATYGYEKLKQQQEFEQQQKDLQVAEQIKRQKIFTIFVIIGFGLVLLLAIFMIIAFKTKQKANIALQDKNAEILQQKEEILSQNEEILIQNEMLQQHKEEIETQRDEIQLQHNIVLKHKEEITASIVYAKRIQFAALPANEYINSMLGEYFILFKPRDIVSGDFYWLKEIKRNNHHYKIIAAADCTGHGVPGAFVSMLGISFLNELVRRAEISNVAILLDELRVQVKTALKQTTRNSVSKDGMDIAIAIIEQNSKILQFSGANNPLFIISNGKLSEEHKKNKRNIYNKTNNKNLTILKANRQPIAIYIKEKPFTKKEVQLKKGDQIYLFSDGFIDQFGGKKRRKFMVKNFKELLLTNSNKPMPEQKEILNQTFENWRGSIEQIDDVVVVGVKI